MLLIHTKENGIVIRLDDILNYLNKGKLSLLLKDIEKELNKFK